MEQRMRKLKKANKSKVNNEHLQCVCVCAPIMQGHTCIYIYVGKQVISVIDSSIQFIDH